jgi:LysM repeat protein
MYIYTKKALDIGRLYTVAASDNLNAIAKRFGTPLEMLYKLNNDLQGKPFIQEGSELCVIPNSCKGQDESVCVRERDRSYPDADRLVQSTGID